MMTVRSARMLARYNQWADRLIFEAVAALPGDEATRPRVGLFKTMVHMLNHNYVIDRVFQAHLEGRAHGYGARNTPEPPTLAELSTKMTARKPTHVGHHSCFGSQWHLADASLRMPGRRDA